MKAALSRDVLQLAAVSGQCPGRHDVEQTDAACQCMLLRRGMRPDIVLLLRHGMTRNGSDPHAAVCC